MHTNSMEESSAWGAGYDAGQEGMAKAIETAELLATKRERERIIKLLETYANVECDEYCAYRCECHAKYEAQMFIALIKGENK